MKSIKQIFLSILNIYSLVQISKAQCGFFGCNDCPGHYWNSFKCTPCPPGTYITGKVEKPCEPCAAGTYADNEASLECMFCPKGQYQAFTGQASCNKCSAGEYQPNTGRSSCDKCSAGRFSRAVGATSSNVCQLCTKGTYSSEIGSSSCTHCYAGSYSTKPIFGATSIDICDGRCPGGTFSTKLGATSSDVCKPCEEGKFQFLKGQSFCYGCPFPLITMNGSDSLCSVCKEGYYMETPPITCKKCPEDSTNCTIGTTIRNITIVEGYWRPSISTSQTYKCNFDSICVGSNRATDDDMIIMPFLPGSLLKSTVLIGKYCAEGYTGALCEACDSPLSHEYFDRLNGRCKKCRPLTFFIQLLIAIALIVPFGFLIWSIRSRLTPLAITMKSLSAQSKIKVLIGFYQIMSSFTDVYGVKIHDKVKRVFHFVTYFFSFDFLSSFPLDCIGSASVAFILRGVWPYLVCICVGLLYRVIILSQKFLKPIGLAKLVGHVAENVSVSQIAIMIFYFALPVVSKGIFAAKICESFKIYDKELENVLSDRTIANATVANETMATDLYESYLVSSRKIKCDLSNADYRNLQVLFWIFFITWPCLTLFGFFLLVTRIFNSIRNERPTQLAIKCQLIWEDFDPKSSIAIYWDIIDFLRKVFLVGFINFIDESEGSRKLLRLTIATAVSILFLLLLLYIRPYRRHDDFQLSVLSSVFIALAFSLGCILQMCDNEEEGVCEKYIGFGIKDSLGASVLVTALMIGMTILTIISLIIQTNLSPIGRLRSTRHPPNLTLPEECSHHVFMSHMWKGGQDLCHSIARKLQLFMPGLRVWLDVDHRSNTSDLERYVNESVVFLLSYSRGYFERPNCRREFFQALLLDKPIVVIYDGDNDELKKMKDECNKNCLNKNDELNKIHEKSGIPVLEWESINNGIREKLNDFISRNFEEESSAIQWLRTGYYSSEALKLIYLRILEALPHYKCITSSSLLSKGLRMPNDEKTIEFKYPVELLVSSCNEGAIDLAQEIQKLNSKNLTKINLTTFQLYEKSDVENPIDLQQTSNKSNCQSVNKFDMESKTLDSIVNEKAPSLREARIKEPLLKGNDTTEKEYQKLTDVSNTLDELSDNNSLLEYASSSNSLPSCFSLEDIGWKGSCSINLDSNAKPQSMTSVQNKDMQSQEFQIMTILESPTFKVFLLYLNEDTFSKENTSQLQSILEILLREGIPLIVLHEKDTKKGAKPNFDYFLDKNHTPESLLNLNIYEEIAIPIYSQKEYRAVSLSSIVKKIIEKQNKSNI